MDCISPWGRKESDTTERLPRHFTSSDSPAPIASPSSLGRAAGSVLVLENFGSHVLWERRGSVQSHGLQQGNSTSQPPNHLPPLQYFATIFNVDPWAPTSRVSDWVSLVLRVK